MTMTLSGTSGITNPSGFTSNATNGYTKLPDGTILQWGTVASVSSGSYQTVNLNITNPTATLAVFATSAASGGAYAVSADVVSTTQIKLLQQAGGAIPVRWFAIGY